MKIFDQNQAPYTVNINDCAYSADIRQCENTENYTKLTEAKTLCEADINSPASCEPLPSTEDGRYRSFDTMFHSMTFDKLKITLQYSGQPPFCILNKQEFVRPPRRELNYYTYNNKEKNIYIKYGETKPHCEYQEVVITFTSSVLDDKMMELICAENIRDCFRRLDEEYHLIHFYDIDYLLNNAYVVSAHVTKDEYLDEEFAIQFHDYTYNNRCNPRKIDFDSYEISNFDMHNTVSNDSKCKRRITFYDKYLKLQDMKKNNQLPIGFNIEKYKNLYRVEEELISVRQIKRYLDIKDNRLYSVLRSKAQPILSTRTQYINFLIAKDCNYDMPTIERKLRGLYKSWTTSRLKPFQAICNKKNQLKEDVNGLQKRIRNLLTIKYKTTIKFTNLVDYEYADG